jgi:peptidoglycan hydrolase-like protein with peptidoglycan-binding domain
MRDETSDVLDVAVPVVEVEVAASRFRRRGPQAGPRTGRRFWMVLALVGVVLAGGAFWAGTLATSPAAVQARYAPAPRTVLTAPVVLRRLSQTLTVQGVITAARVYKVSFGPVSVPGAQPIITARPPRPGTVVSEGMLLAQVAGRPIFALTGTTPMYRDLTLGDHGPDVAQLQAGLAALGFPANDSRGVYGHGTAAAVRAFYARAGYAPATAGTGKGKTVVVPQAEVVFVPRLPAVVQSSSLALGQPVTNPALMLTGGALSAVMSLTTAQAAIVQRGDSARLYIRSSGGAGPAAIVGARVAAVRAAPAGKGAESGRVAVLRPVRPLAQRLLGRQADAVIVIAVTRAPVLAVPVAALYTTASGQSVVTVITHGRRVNIPVQVGTETGGYVPVRPVHGTLAPGNRVLVGQ